LQEARAAGCRSSVEADRYLAHKRRKESEESACRARESAHVVPNNHGVQNALMSPDSAGTRPAGSSSVNEMDATGYYGADLLSEAVRIIFFCQVCILKLYIASYFVF